MKKTRLSKNALCGIIKFGVHEAMNVYFKKGAWCDICLVMFNPIKKN